MILEKGRKLTNTRTHACMHARTHTHTHAHTQTHIHTHTHTHTHTEKKYTHTMKSGTTHMIFRYFQISTHKTGVVGTVSQKESMNLLCNVAGGT